MAADCDLCGEKKPSKKQPVNAVKASRLEPADVIARCRELGKAHGFRLETYGESQGYPLIAMTKRTPGPRPRIYLSAAQHGDEPAGPAGLLRLLEEKRFDARANWFLCPLLNPVGLAKGTRENAEGIDLNRDYRGTPRSNEVAAHVTWLQRQPRFDLALCLHEDWETYGFYLYELNPKALPSYAESIVESVAKICPLQLTDVIEGRPAKGGIIRPDIDPATRELWPESVHLRLNHTSRCYTTETPSVLPLEQRALAQCAAVETAVNLLIESRRAETNTRA
jgi:succinylglutamate desuccinylase/aspartoacylase family protein